ncbi:hypothetical protein [Paenibacillus andongensis]|uniref:hypothetical protein n=1 Tax=Paenibacillus andongensis TaxID=2975482 RepID=UPI0021BAAB87|nr:hypothetical protein [Paenibacillus andongensis]
MYISHGNSKKKVRMFYENQSDQTLSTIKKFVILEVDSFPTFGEQIMLLDRIFALMGKLFKPILPLVSLIVLLFGIGSNYLAFSQAEDYWSKLEVMTRYACITISILFLLTILNIFFENKWKRGVGILSWLFIVGIIFCPCIFYIISNKFIAYSFILQVVFFVALFRIKNNPSSNR